MTDTNPAEPVPTLEPTFSELELERYSSQFAITGWDQAAQLRLRDAYVVVVGAGALGCAAATQLAAAGVGELAIVDGAEVELSNLNRQPLHFTPDVGGGKADSAAQKLGLLNPELQITPFPAYVDEQNAGAILLGADLVLDCSELVDAHGLINDACVQMDLALVLADVAGIDGTLLVVRPHETACYRCVFPDVALGPDATECPDMGMLGAAAGLIGSLQALAAINLLTGIGDLGSNVLHKFDGTTLAWQKIPVARDVDCACCGLPPATTV